MLRPLLKLDREARVPLYRQLEIQLREGILVGRFRPGLPLPGVRSLARELGIGRITVSAAYEELAADGYLERRVGVGTRVAHGLPAPFLRHGARPPGIELGRLPVEPAFPPAARTVDFRTGRIDVGLMPATVWERLLRDAWRDLARDRPALASNVHESEGDPRLREAITMYFSATRGVRCTPEQVVIVGSAHAACAIAGRLALRTGDICVVEDPSAPQLRRSLDVLQPRIAPFPVDEQGMTTDGLPAGGKMALVSPAWQLPTGARMSMTRRAALLAWAASNRALVVEADLYGHLRYDQDDEPALQADAAAGQVIYVATFSTMLYPGVRTAFAIVPHALLPAFRRILEATERPPGAVEQVALARFIDEGHLGRHVLRLRQVYADRQAVLLDGLRAHLSGRLEASPSAAGTALVGRIVDDRLTASRLAVAAKAANVDVDPLNSFRIVPAGDRELLLAYAHLAPIEIEAGIRRLGIAIQRTVLV